MPAVNLLAVPGNALDDFLELVVLRNQHEIDVVHFRSLAPNRSGHGDAITERREFVAHFIGKHGGWKKFHGRIPLGPTPSRIEPSCVVNASSSFRYSRFA